MSSDNHKIVHRILLVGKLNQHLIDFLNVMAIITIKVLDLNVSDIVVIFLIISIDLWKTIRNAILKFRHTMYSFST